MRDTLSYMVERSRFDIDRLMPRPEDVAGLGDSKLIDDAADALFACSYVQVCGPMLARAAAERRALTIEGAVRRAGLEREVIARLKRKAKALCGFFHLH